jgi:hypothetical protein
LLPSLNKARRAATLVTCSSQLRQVGLATVNYANDNQGSLPPYTKDTGLPTFGIPNGDASAFWNITQNLGNTPDAGAGIGTLIIQKYCNDPRIAWCPASDAGKPVYYCYNPHLCYRTSGNSLYLQAWWKKFNNYGKVPNGAVNAVALASFDSPSGTAPVKGEGNHQFAPNPRCLACDNVDGIANSTHAQNAGVRAWNLLFPDGHVSPSIVDAALVRAYGKFNRDLDIIDAMETVANNETFNVGNTASWTNTDDYAPVDPH